MSLVLSSGDTIRLDCALRALLSPLEHPAVDDWGRAVNRAMRALLHADMATFGLPVQDSASVVSEGLPLEAVTAYPARLAPMDRSFGLWKRQLELGVWSRASLYHPHEKEMYASEYYNDFVVPIRGFDAVGITMEAKDNTFVGLMFHHDRPSGPRFGARGVALLRLVEPAFRAGVTAHSQLHAHRDRLARMLDTVSEGLLVFDLDGRLLHRNRALARLLEPDPEAERVRGEMRELARSLLALAGRQADGSGGRAARRCVREIGTARARYRARGSYGGSGLLARDGVILVALERLTPILPSEAGLRERFGLTRKQAQVALLLARGSSNDEVARELFISPHTARHHTEQVLLKLGLHSRAEVAPKILAC